MAGVSFGGGATQGWTRNYLDARDYQDSVKDKDLTAPPGSPSEGDRYIVASPATGDWLGKENNIAVFTSGAWLFVSPNEGYWTEVEDENKIYIFIALWVDVSTIIDHGSLVGLGDDDHSQYHNDTRGDARYFRENEHLNASAGAGDAGKPIVLDADGHVDATMINDADVDHGSIGGLADDDHSQYHNDTRGDARYFQKTEFIATTSGGSDAGKPIKTNASGVVDSTFFSSSPFPRGHAYSEYANNSGDANNDLDISVAEARDTTNAFNLVLSSSITGRKDAAWVVGTNQGKMDTGTDTSANIIYAIWLIKRSDTSVVDILFSASFSAPTMPTNYDQKARIGSFLTDGSNNVRAMKVVKNRVTLSSLSEILSDATLTSKTFETLSVPAPPNARIDVTCAVINSGSSSAIAWLKRTGTTLSLDTGTPGTATDAERQMSFFCEASATASARAKRGTVDINGSSQLDYAAFEPSGTSTIVLTMFGWIDQDLAA